MSISAKNGHDWCLLCGERNPWSLKLAFHSDSGGVKAVFRAHQGLQGYDGILHGGVISALLDAAMTHCLFHHGVQAVTGDLYVRFVHSVPYLETVNLRAWISSSTPPLYLLKSELTAKDQVMAWAEAKFIKQEARS